MLCASTGRPAFKAFWANMPEAGENFDECFEFTRDPRATSTSDVSARHQRLLRGTQEGADEPELPSLAPEHRRARHPPVPNPLPEVDGLLAATAMVHDLVLVTHNVKDVRATGVRCLNPFGLG